jgi:hypothetical protein
MGFLMRLSVFAALAVATAAVLALPSVADAQQQRRGYGPQPRGERITIIDENGRVRTKITVRARSFMDGGTEVIPGERKFMDYAAPAGYMNASPYAAWDPTGIHRFPLPRPGELPGYAPYSYW